MLTVALNKILTKISYASASAIEIPYRGNLIPTFDGDPQGKITLPHASTQWRSRSGRRVKCRTTGQTAKVIRANGTSGIRRGWKGGAKRTLRMPPCGRGTTLSQLALQRRDAQCSCLRRRARSTHALPRGLKVMR